MFVASVKGFLEAGGSKAGWTSYSTTLYLQGSGSRAIDWETDKLIMLQIFRGPVQAWHWASLIIDHTRPNQSLAVFADSLPDYSYVNSFAGNSETLSIFYSTRTANGLATLCTHTAIVHFVSSEDRHNAPWLRSFKYARRTSQLLSDRARMVLAIIRSLGSSERLKLFNLSKL
jgi:hypothetical protein